MPVEGHLYGERVWFYDARGHVRRMGVSTHPADSTIVISLWQGDVCTGTFRLPAKDAARLISTLAYGMTEAIPGQATRHRSRSEPTWPDLVKIPASCVRPITQNDRDSSSAAQVRPLRTRQRTFQKLTPFAGTGCHRHIGARPADNGWAPR